MVMVHLELVREREYQKRGAVHCFYGVNQGLFLTTVLWMSFHEVQIQMTGSQHMYVKLFKMQRHCRIPEHYLKGYSGNTLHTCKYGFPFAIFHRRNALMRKV